MTRIKKAIGNQRKYRLQIISNAFDEILLCEQSCVYFLSKCIHKKKELQPAKKNFCLTQQFCTFSQLFIFYSFFSSFIFRLFFFSYACANSKIIAQYTIKNQKKKNQTHSHHNSHIDDQGRDYYDGHSHNNDHAK